jgi:hypothetical protein
MLFNWFCSSGTAFRSESVEAVDAAVAIEVSEALLSGDTQESVTELLVLTAFSIAARHSRIWLIPSIPARRNSRENPVFSGGGEAGAGAAGRTGAGSVNTIWLP